MHFIWTAIQALVRAARADREPVIEGDFDHAFTSDPRDDLIIPGDWRPGALGAYKRQTGREVELTKHDHPPTVQMRLLSRTGVELKTCVLPGIHTFAELEDEDVWRAVAELTGLRLETR